MALILRNGFWYWRKMVDGVTLNRSTKTDDKKQAEQLAKKWEHEAVQQIVFDGERPVTVHEAIKGFLNDSKHMKGYGSALNHMTHWTNAVRNVPMKSLQQHELQEIVTKRLAEGVSAQTDHEEAQSAG